MNNIIDINDSSTYPNFLIDSFINDYEIDYDNLVVHFHNKDYGWYTYSIIVVVDVAFINEELKEIFHLE